ncbi:MAG: DUF998 domain-containing protein [Thermoplasmatales archaeon]|nr:DUF998 domain-containing protein [Candidatus Thermoplasmatota archaeon]MDA8054095.1 DUF998 domain-containing protein [Thermoplasmatales archaeon]
MSFHSTGQTDNKIGDGMIVKVAGSLLLTAGILFFLLNTVAEGLYPNYSVASNYLSDLGALGANTSLLWNGMLFIVGLLFAISMYLLFFRDTPFRKRAGHGRTTQNLTGVLYILPGIGSIIVSLFQENSVLGAAGLHDLGALIAFLFGGIAAIYTAKFTKFPFRYFSVLLGLLDLVFIPVYFISSASIVGLTERLIVYPFIIWGIAFGSYLIGSPYFDKSVL